MTDDANLLNSDSQEREPFLVEPGWVRSEFIPHTGGPSYRVLFYENGVVRFEHRCDRGDRGTVICAPALQLGRGHMIEQDHPLTITRSIECPDCGTHGFVRNGRWVAS